MRFSLFHLKRSRLSREGKKAEAEFENKDFLLIHEKLIYNWLVSSLPVAGSCLRKHGVVFVIKPCFWAVFVFWDIAAQWWAAPNLVSSLIIFFASEQKFVRFFILPLNLISILPASFFVGFLVRFLEGAGTEVKFNSGHVDKLWLTGWPQTAAGFWSSPGCLSWLKGLRCCLGCLCWSSFLQRRFCCCWLGYLASGKGSYF